MEVATDTYIYTGIYVAGRLRNQFVCKKPRMFANILARQGVCKHPRAF